MFFVGPGRFKDKNRLNSETGPRTDNVARTAEDVRLASEKNDRPVWSIGSPVDMTVVSPRGARSPGGFAHRPARIAGPSSRKLTRRPEKPAGRTEKSAGRSENQTG